MDIQVVSRSGESLGAALTVSDQTFGREFNAPLVHQIVVAYLARGRAGTRAQKGRSDVSGGGAKPWRQKGTGRARAGTIRSPLWRGGGVTFAARPHSYGQKVNRKMYRGALRAILSELVRQQRLTVVDELGISEPKTRLLVERLSELGLKRALLIVASGDGANLQRAARNLVGVEVLDAAGVDPVSLIRAERVLMSVEALRRVEETLS